MYTCFQKIPYLKENKKQTQISIPDLSYVHKLDYNTWSFDLSCDLILFLNVLQNG